MARGIDYDRMSVSGWVYRECDSVFSVAGYSTIRR